MITPSNDTLSFDFPRAAVVFVCSGKMWQAAREVFNEEVDILFVL